MLFSICLNNKVDFYIIEKLLNYINSCEVPKFPISGDYLIKHGYESSQELGNKLKLIEEKWIENNFILDKNLIEKFLNKKKPS